jgi:hypothetical protein
VNVDAGADRLAFDVPPFLWSVIRGAYLGVDRPDVEVLRELL